MKNNQKGTINLTNPGLISHNEILQMYKEIVDPSFTWENFTYEEQMEILVIPIPVHLQIHLKSIQSDLVLYM